MNKIRLLTTTALAAAPLTIAIASAMAQEPFPTVTWSPGEVFLANGDTKTLAHSKTPRAARVCVAQKQRNAEIRITADDESVTVHPGDCVDVEGRIIRASPSGLGPNDVLVLRYDVKH